MYIAFFIGNIASGKTTATRYLESRGAYRIDLDEMAKRLYVPGSRVVAELAGAFGSKVLDSLGGIDRHALAQRAFETPEATERLNAIVHPALRAQLANIVLPVQCCSTVTPQHELTIIEVSVPGAIADMLPLADETVAISASLEYRRARACERGMDADDFDSRAQRQPDEGALCALATTVIANEGTPEELASALDEWLSTRGLLQGDSLYFGAEGSA